MKKKNRKNGELKSCPFCGIKPTIVKHDDGTFAIRHYQFNDCWPRPTIPLIVGENDMEQSIEKWNRRV